MRVSPHPIPELEEFLEPYAKHFYRRESLETLERYATGLMADIDHKSGAGVANAVAGLSDSSVHRLMGETVWDEWDVNEERIGTMVDRAVAGDGMVIPDGSGLPRKGTKSVGVARQYCGELGKVANCQVVVTLQYADPYYAWPITGRLYLPEDWCTDEERRTEAQVPGDIEFRTKPEIALRLIDEADAAGVPFEIAGGDSVYGDNPTYLDGLREREIACVVEVSRDFGVRLPVDDPEKTDIVTEAGTALGPQRRADTVIADQDESAWELITWREGSAGPLRKEVVALRAHRSHGETVGPAGWLFAERSASDETGPHKYFWSSMAADVALARLVELAHRRPGIERGYQDGKQETGFGDYPARLWHSFHRHLVIQFLVLSWLSLQRPDPDEPEIVIEPPDVDAPEETFFPVRA